MTTLAVLADIHGNLPALQAVVEDLAQFDVDHVVVAGDVINWGPFSAQVVEYIVAEGWAVIRGNAEYYLLNYDTPRAPAEWNDPANYPMLPWLHRQLAGRLHTLIAAWPDSITLYFPDAPAARVVHGSPRSAWEPIYAISSVAEVDRMIGG
ncbi:MAG TPA: metallophosphoesterase, partial [Ardenticatenaceae bacterium]|nr:metallophosphoesterase [Ardenticatenaceae bacterium]